MNKFTSYHYVTYTLINILLANPVFAQTITVQLQWKHQFEFAGFYAAIERGYYARHGLDVKLREYHSGTDIVAEVLSGRSQYGTHSSSIVKARLEGKPVVLLANYFKQMPLVILTQPDITQIADLSGKTLMISNSDLESPLYKMLLKRGGLIPGQNLTVIPHTFDAKPFLRGEVAAMSAFVTNEPFYLEQRHIKFNIIELSQYMRSLGDVYLFTSEQQAQAYPEQTQHFIEATNQGWEYALNNQKEIVDLILRKYSQRKSRQALMYEAEKTQELVMPLPLPIGSIFPSLIQDVARLITDQQGFAKVPNYLEDFFFKPPHLNQEWLLNNLVPRKYYTILMYSLVSTIFIAIFILIWNLRLSREIARRKQTEQQLRLLFSAVEQSHSTILITDADAKIEFVNSAFCQITGYSKEEAIGKNPRILKSGKQDQHFYASMWESILLNNGWKGELCNKRKDGTVYWEFANISPVSNAQGVITHYVAVKENITERKLIEQALQRSRKQYQRLVENIGFNFVVYSHDTSGILQYASQGIEHVFGITQEQAIGYCFAEIIPWRTDSLDLAWGKITSMLNTGIPEQFEMFFARPGDSEGVIMVNAHPVQDDNGKYDHIEGIVEDITERKQSELRLQINEEKLRTLYELSPVGIALTNIQGQYIDFNAAFMDICGYPAEELKKLDYWQLTPIEYAAQEQQQLQILKQTGRYGPYEKEYRRQDGTRIPLRLNGVLVTDQVGQTCIWSLVEDITRQKTYEAELQQAKETAEAANRAKSTFLASMSHELRTPLNAILGYAQILQHDATIGKNQLQEINIIKKSGEYLLALIEDILDLARVETGNLELCPHILNLHNFFTDISNMFRIRAIERGITFEYQYPEHLPVAIKIDEKRLRQICINLLGNAIKFTERGSVSLKTGYADNQLVIDVIDTGIGIPQDMLEQIFKPFVQTGDNKYRQQGTGLGLAISHGLVEHMHGKLQVTSMLKQGSHFRVSIPVTPVAFNNTNPQHQTISAIGKIRRTDNLHTPLHILIVDDLAQNRTMLNTILTTMGATVTEAASGIQALQIVEHQDFDIIIMDIVMPDMDGITTTTKILERSGPTNKLIVALTASAFSADRNACINAGCVDFLTKPLEITALQTTLCKYLPIKIEVSQKIESPVTESAEITTEIVPLNDMQRQHLMKLINSGSIHESIKYLEQMITAADCPNQAHLLLAMAKSYKLADIRRILQAVSTTQS
ncbi:hypothetical protein TI04_06010 [Achromatium sp. WMS2]|nr:hypothetical protein TI04_06010 [Achromatium sp. WMS2]